LNLRCIISIVLSLHVYTVADLGAQSTVMSTEEFSAFLERLKRLDCIEDVPAPTLFTEPRYTQGTSNTVCFQLPDTTALPFPPDTIKVPHVITHAINHESGEVLEYPRPVVLTDENVQFESTASLLENGVSYFYTIRLVLPICDATCDDIAEQHCSAFRDTVWSIQDTNPPVTEEVVIPQLEGSSIPGWTSQSNLNIDAAVADPAGVWQAFLFRRACGTDNWDLQVADTTLSGALTDSGYVFAEQAQVTFQQNLPDGCYQFRVEGRDATHTPESCFPNFELAGNGGQPADSEPAQLTVNIDNTPPDSVALTCEQEINEIHLSWTAASDSAPGIGLAGYRIVRDGEIIAELDASQTAFAQTIPIATPETQFVYQVQPYDSLRNVQTEGGRSVCLYRPVSQIVMLPEPEFTSGDSNQVCWTGSPNIDTFTVHRARDCDISASVSTTLTDTCFTFTQLQDGETYCYWVTAVDRQGRTVVSDTVASTQDATFPQIANFDIAERKALGENNWVNTRDLHIELTAEDRTPGLIETLQIFENGEPREPVAVTPDDEIELEIPYTLNASECAPITLTAQVMDAAGNPSAVLSITFKLDETPPTPVTITGCEQLTGLNGMGLQWSASSEPASCSGLKQYRILRDGDVIASVPTGTNIFEDLLPMDTPNATFTYQIQPVDSLDNVQTADGRTTCDYQSASFVIIDAVSEFSPGLSNEVCWDVSGTLNTIKVFIDDSSDGVADDSVTFANVQSRMCHTFTGLEDGRRYSYWVIGVDDQQRLAASDTVTSIQDNTPPTILDFEFTEGEQVDDQRWTYDRDINLDVLARDAAPGELWNYVLRENTLSQFEETFRDSVSDFNGKISYQIVAGTEQSTRIDLTLRVLDGAGNESTPKTLTLYLQENAPRLFAFPNPFNPKNESTTIRVQDIEETEIKIFDFFGNHVQTLTRKENDHDFRWNGRNGNGEMVANGGYVCVGSETGARFKIAVVKK